MAKGWAGGEAGKRNASVTSRRQRMSVLPLRSFFPVGVYSLTTAQRRHTLIQLTPIRGWLRLVRPFQAGVLQCFATPTSRSCVFSLG